MTSRTVSIDPVLGDYLSQIGLRESPTLRALREYTATHRMAKMQIAPEQGRFLAWLVRLTGVRRYLEVGVFTGYSTLAVAEALPPDGRITACDVSEEFTAIARDYWQQAGVAERIELILQPAIRTLQTLVGEGREYDMVFIDADKPSCRDYYELALQLVRPGGVIAIDNIFLSGRVVAPRPEDPPGVHLMHAFNDELVRDERVELCVLPVGDGMTLLTRR